ncbi:MAG: gamma carbonic anhydrase family protein [Chloroflexi bacterium]|nr:gamma carbonic anhydrase family protein [Chloroflexota bacterium]
MIRSLDGKTPRIADSAFVSEAAYVVGNVEIGEHSNVWPGAVIRADFGPIRIGKYTSIQDNSVLHVDDELEIGDHILIGHGVIVHGRKIGSNVLLGNNATILNNTEIGDFCIIGAGAVVPPGMVIPSGSFVIGIPARIQREITPEQRKRLENQGDGYARNGKRFKDQGL